MTLRDPLKTALAIVGGLALVAAGAAGVLTVTVVRRGFSARAEPSGPEVLLARTQIQVIHRYENAPLRWLEPIADIGQGPIHDRAHRVREVRILQLALDGDVGDVAATVIP